MQTDKRLLDVLAGKPTAQMPIWLMRQAGRYLPEYRAVRAQANGFLDLCLTPTLATEVTLQPIRRFGFDAAILFADILLVPHGLGQRLDFQEGEGPVLEPLRDGKALAALRWQPARVAAVYETVARLKTALPPEVALIGFAGAPWTVACYMIEGRGKTGFPHALRGAAQEPELLRQVLRLLHDATLDYLGQQIAAGAEAVQLFDSWAGLLDDAQFAAYVIAPTKALVAALKARFPHIPVIGFPRGVSAANYRRYAQETGIDGLSLDQSVPLDFARAELRGLCALQGNLDPEILVQGGEAMKTAIRTIRDSLGPRHIFNLGHGILPQTPPEHVAQLVAWAREAREPMRFVL